MHVPRSATLATRLSDTTLDLLTLRRVLWWLAAGSALATGVELVFIRHWEELSQASAFLPLLAAGIALVMMRPDDDHPHATLVGRARLLLGFALVMAVVGIGFHVHGNFESGPLDAVRGGVWDQTGLATRLWWSVTGAVGPAPSLAPLALANTGVLGLLATVRPTPGTSAFTETPSQHEFA